MKGKYAARAANRREAAEAEQNEAAYQRRILKLIEERDAARTERDEARADWAKEVRILRAQLAEGASPRVEALTRQLNQMRENRDRLRREVRRLEDAQATAGWRLADHFVAEHGVHRDDHKEQLEILAHFFPRREPLVGSAGQ